MMYYEVDEVLNKLMDMAKADPGIAQKLFDCRLSATPVSQFCELSTSLGYPLYEMDLISAGEDYYAAMRRSTNGGGENHSLLEYSDDYYELFMARLSELVSKQHA